MGTETKDEIAKGMDALRKVEIAWLSRELGDAIAGLGYPVGCGIRPHDKQLKHAAKILFNRYAKMIELARRAESQSP